MKKQLPVFIVTENESNFLFLYGKVYIKRDFKLYPDILKTIKEISECLFEIKEINPLYTVSHFRYIGVMSNLEINKDFCGFILEWYYG